MKGFIPSSKSKLSPNDRVIHLALRVEHASQVAPRHSKVRPRLDGFQIACLVGDNVRSKEEGKQKRKGGEKIPLVWYELIFLFVFV